MLRTFCELLTVKDALLADFTAATKPNERRDLRRDLRSLVSELRQLSDRLGVNPRARQHMEIPSEEDDGSLDEWAGADPNRLLSH